MAISDKITSIQNHLKDDWDSVESLIGDTELDKNIENISSALDDLYNDLPKVTGSGTSITLDSTRKGRLESTLSGNTSQTQYSGKNLLPPTIATETKNGITLTNNGDGSYTLTGTYSTSTTFDMALPATLNGTYSFSGNNPTAGKNIQFRISASSGSSLSTYLNDVNKTVENKTIENGTKQGIRIVGSFTSGFTLKPQLESGSTATSYEPYVGGVATPNPTTPIPVNVVSGDNTIKVESRNLLNANFSSNTINGVTQIGVNNVITLNGANNKAHSFDFPNTITYEPNTTYTTHVKIIGGSFTPYKQDSNWAIQVYNLSGTSNITLTSNNYNSVFQYSFNKKTTIRPRLWFGWEGTSRQGTDGVFDNLQIQIMVVKGAYSLSDYPTFEPFDGDYYPINLPVENKFDDSTTTNILIAADGTEQANNAIKTSIYIKVEPNTLYTCSSKLLPNKTSGWLKFSYYDASKNYLSYLYTDNTIRTITTPNNCVYIRIGYHTSNVNDVQFEKGSKANSYTPFGTTPIELCKIGNYQDYFAKSDGTNLFDKDNANKLDCLLNGQNGSIANYSGAKLMYIPCESSTTYTISKIKSARFVVGTSSSTPSNGVTCSVYQANNDATSITITSGTSDKFLCVFYYLSSADTLTEQQILDSIMINEGSSALPWQPYGVGKWYLHKEIGKVVLNGSENWSAFASVNYEYQLSLFAGLSTDTSNQYFPALCNKYINHNVAGSSLSNYEFSHFSTQPSTVKERFVRFRNNDITTLANWKTELQTNNAILYVPLATPTNTEITDTILINQIEQFYRAQSKNNQTNISQVNNDLGFIISASALKKGDTIENNSASLLMSFGGLSNTNDEEETPDFEEDVSDVEEETPIEESIEEETDEEPVEEETEIEEEGE